MSNFYLIGQKEFSDSPGTAIILGKITSNEFLWLKFYLKELIDLIGQDLKIPIYSANKYNKIFLIAFGTDDLLEYVNNFNKEINEEIYHIFLNKELRTFDFKEILRVFYFEYEGIIAKLGKQKTPRIVKLLEGLNKIINEKERDHIIDALNYATF